MSIFRYIEHHYCCPKVGGDSRTLPYSRVGRTLCRLSGRGDRLSAYSRKFSGDLAVDHDRTTPIRFPTLFPDGFCFGCCGYYVIGPDTDTVYMATRWVTCSTYACRPRPSVIVRDRPVFVWMYTASDHCWNLVTIASLRTLSNVIAVDRLCQLRQT